MLTTNIPVNFQWKLTETFLILMLSSIVNALGTVYLDSSINGFLRKLGTKLDRAN